MTQILRIALAQLNFTVGDINGNLIKHKEAAIKARDEFAADLIVFPELSLTGYPPEDLLLRKSFITDAKNALKQLKREIKGIACLVGHPYAKGRHLFNACSLIQNGKLIGRYSKQRLPNYGVFDECRYFTSGTGPCVLPFKNTVLGIVICEDLWKLGPTRDTVAGGAKIIISPNASPFEINKHERRLSVLGKRARYDNVPIVYVNPMSGQDEIMFDGGSMVVNGKGELCQFAGFFNETILPVDIDIKPNVHVSKATITVPTSIARTYQALTHAVRDYIHKNQVRGILVGVSGGIDSALTLAIAVDAIGKDRVRAVFMPSRYTAEISKVDATAVANNLGITLETFSIEPTYQAFLDTLTPAFTGKKPDVAEENIQARCRAVILMALSNQSGYLVLTTGNRSELAVGYCTLYGDMAGGFAVLKDIPKTMVYELAHYRNTISSVIPERTLHRAPTAELAPNQKDEDTLPPYVILDQILEYYINQSLSIPEIVAQGFDEHTVKRIVQLIHKSEYKRKQAALGPHVNHKSFCKDWRYPVANKYKS